jgi:MipA family protein
MSYPRRATISPVVPTLAALVASLAATASLHAQDATRSFTGAIGVGVVAMPKYPGSDEYRVLPMPVGQLEYKNRLFVGASKSGVGGGIGAYVVRSQSFVWDVTLSGAESRAEGRGDALAGMGKRSGASYAGSAVSYRAGSALGTVTASGGLSVGLGHDEGTYGTLGLAAERSFARRWTAGVSTGATIADARSMAFDFGVTGEQSATRHALIAAHDPRLAGIDGRAFAPGAGLRELRGGASVGYALSPRSRVLAFAQATRLGDEASRSPLVRQRTGVASGMAIAYGF